MAFNVQTLEGPIRGILQAPGVDLATISAKRVRKRLVEMEELNLTADVVKEHKDDIDAMISTVYEQVSAAMQTGEADEGYEEGEGGSETGEGSVKRKREDDEEEDEKPAPVPKKAKAPRKSKTELTDEELARQLSNEINGRTRAPRTAAGRNGKANGSKRGGKKKSAEMVDSDGEIGSDGEVKPKKRRGGFTKEYMLSDPLSSLLGVEKLSRPQVVKQIWEHIKANSLQNPQDKREIICDERMRAIFNVDKINMFKMNKALGDHLHEPAPQ